MSIRTIQVSGAGNTFNVVFENDETKKISDRRQFVSSVCDASKTDGFIFLNWLNESENKLTWDFYNNDGSAAEMCGNATRCVGFYMKNILKLKKNFYDLQTIAGLINIKIENETTFEVRMTAIEKYDHASYFWCDTGVPHIVIEIDDFDAYLNLKEKCRELRFHSDFMPRGTNVTLISFLGVQSKLRAVSYERGVEDFTQACGTGAMAAAFYNLIKNNVVETYVEMPGGTLKMNLQDLKNPTMSGEAHQIGEYVYDTKN